MPGGASLRNCHSGVRGQITVTYVCNQPFTFVCTTCKYAFRRKQDNARHRCITTQHSNAAILRT